MRQHERGLSPPRRLRPERVVESNVGTTLVDFIHQVAPSKPFDPSQTPEQVQFVQFQECHLNDSDWSHKIHYKSGSGPPLICVVGLAKGYQIWALIGNGICEELLSDRQGPIKFVKILTIPKNCVYLYSYTLQKLITSSGTLDSSNQTYGSKHPLVAICDQTSTVAGREGHSVGFVSLKSGDYVHSFRYEYPVADLLVSSSLLAVVFNGHIKIYDFSSFDELFWINDCFKPDNPSLGTPASLSYSWIAFADSHINCSLQSCGGGQSRESTPETSVTGQVFTAAKKTVAALGDSLASSLGHKPPTSTSNIPSQNSGIVTIIDVRNLTDAKLPLTSKDGLCVHYSKMTSLLEGQGSTLLAHFVAHQEPLARIEIKTDLVLTAGLTGCEINVFKILTHPGGSGLATVHQLYALQRGMTPATLTTMKLSSDSRWVAIGSSHGTCHVFGINSYGGPITIRTHGSKRVVNKESRFQQSAGLDSIDILKQTFPKSITLQPLARIKQLALLSSNLSSLAADITKVQTGKSPVHLAASFGLPRAHRQFHKGVPSHKRDDSTTPENLYILRENGVMTEYEFRVRPEGEGKPTNHNTGIRLTPQPVGQWTLQRTSSNRELRPPLPIINPLISAFNQLEETGKKSEKRLDDRSWVSQIETVTYMGPHRRVWMGPQFTFKTFVEPNDGSTVAVTSSKTATSQPQKISSSAAVVPVVIEANSGSFREKPPLKTVEVCGSWSDKDYIQATESHQTSVRQSIAEAMAEEKLEGKDETDCCREDRSETSEDSYETLQFMSMEL